MQTLENAKHVADALSVATVVATLAGWLPPLAALLTVLYTAVRLWETRTVQGWRARVGRFFWGEG